MNRIMSVLIAGTVVIISASCGGGKAVMRNPGTMVIERYPDALYLVREGTGSSRDEAENAARFEIARFFESRISGESIVRRWAKSVIAGGKTRERFATELTRVITVAAERDIPGIVIADAARSGDTWRAWAVLDRAAYHQTLDERLTALDREIIDRLALPRGSDLAYAKTLGRSLAALTERERLRGDLSVLGFGLVPPSRSEQASELLVELERLLSDSFVIALKGNSAGTGRTGGTLAGALSAAGFRVGQTTTDDADMVLSWGIESTVSQRPLKIGDDTVELVRIDWDLDLTAAEPGKSMQLGSVSFHDTVTGNDETQAQRLMNARIGSDQARKTASWVYELVFGETPQQ